MDRSTTSELLETLHALNRLFLSFLQQCVRRGRIPLDLPRAVEHALAVAESEELERIAAVPRALFRICLVDTVQAPPPMHLVEPLEQMRRSLRLTVLLTVWTTVRQSVHRARFFYGLDDETLERLRAATLVELPELATAAEMLRCGFADAEPLWRSLFALPPNGLKPELYLLALQPEITSSSAGGTARAPVLATI